MGRLLLGVFRWTQLTQPPRATGTGQALEREVSVIAMIHFFSSGSEGGYLLR
jgi:hypothetical protein